MLKKPDIESGKAETGLMIALLCVVAIVITAILGLTVRCLFQRAGDEVARKTFVGCATGGSGTGTTTTSTSGSGGTSSTTLGTTTSTIFGTPTTLGSTTSTTDITVDTSVKVGEE